MRLDHKMKISHELIEQVLARYKPQQRVLVDANLDYPLLEGDFHIGDTYYMNPPLIHATDIEIQLCLNQLVYVGIAEIMREGLVRDLGGFNFLELQGENMLIIESRKRFRRPIPTNRNIHCALNIKRFRGNNGLILSWSDFQFENYSCIGSLELALVKPNLRQNDN